jgi:hypothetical protein
MAPALAVFLLGLFLSGGPMRDSGGLGSPAAASMILGTNTQDSAMLVACLPTAVHSPHNNLPSATFEWTNEPASLTTSAPFTGTNTLFY